jgi:hypothetical protein
MQSPAGPVLAFPAPDEAQSQALSADIQGQLAQLPAAIADVETYRRAKESLPLLKRAEVRVVDFFRDIKSAASKAHRAICEKENEQLRPIQSARQRVSSLIYGYEQTLERQRREEERRAAEDERRRIEAQAVEEAAVLSGIAPEMAEQILEQAIAAPAPSITLPSTRVDVAGVSTTANWQWKFAGCASGLAWEALPEDDRQRVLRVIPREYLRPDDKAIGKVVKALRGGTRIPGIETFDAGTIRVRG